MPIRVRLAIWYSAIFGVVLLFFSIALYTVMAQHLSRMVDDAISHRVEHLTAAIQAANPSATDGSTLTIPSLDAFESPGEYVQVALPQGAVLSTSSNLQGRTLPILGEQPSTSSFPTSLDGTSLKATIAPVTIGGRLVAWVEVAASYEPQDSVLGKLRWGLIGGGIAAVAAVGFLSFALAGRALRPVPEMTEMARAIALSRGFSRRLKAGGPNDELGQMAATFNEMLASLEEAYSAQQRFTADASHELRAPLAVIRGNLDLLDRMKEMPDEERRQTLAQVRREVERLSRLVSDLLALARADAGQTLETRPVELDALLVDVYRQAHAIANGVSIRMGHLEPVVTQGDEGRLKELLLILLDNALRYTPVGGTVTLWLRRELPWVTIGVEDTGIGIEPKDLPHIFDRFWRADKARSKDSGGTGLGLSIAKWIVDRHGGEILVESTPGKGTRFMVRLPAYSEETPAHPSNLPLMYL